MPSQRQTLGVPMTALHPFCETAVTSDFDACEH